MSVLLTRRAVLQAIIETTYGSADAVGVNDGVLVSNPDPKASPNVLERDFTRDSLSPQAILMGRKLQTFEFTTELRGNGKQNSGIITDAPIIARLFRACGYSLTAYATPFRIGPYQIGDQINPISWGTIVTSTATNTEVIAYYLAVDTGGASATARITVTSDTTGEGNASAIVTSGSPFTVGTKGMTMVPTFTGNLVVGQRWVVWLTPAGLRLDPVSDNFESVHLVMHKEGVLHDMPGSYGTFEITAEAGQYASVKWTFTGQWVNPIDNALPSPVYEKTLPAMVELARLRMDAFNGIVSKFTYNQQNDIQIRPDVSSAEGYVGTRIVSRKPEGGIDPEADLVANYDFWGKFGAATRMPFQMRIGKVAGNKVWFMAPNVQYSGMSYTDRNGISAYAAGLRFAGYQSNDETCIFLC